MPGPEDYAVLARHFEHQKFLMLDIGFWSPLPPQRSGIADYSYNLLGELAKTHRVTAIVGDKCISSYLAGSADVCAFPRESNLLATLN